MVLRAKPIAACVSETASPTAEELISKLRTSFYPQEFNHAAKTLTEREERMKQNYLKLKTKAKEEKDVLVSENLKLSDELKKKQSEIDAVKKLNTEHETKFRGYEKRSLEYLELKTKTEAKDYENQKLNDELKKKQTEIDAMMKQIADYERKFRGLDFYYKVLGSEKVAKESMVSSINLENKEEKDCAAESYRKPPLFSEKKDSKKKTEHKLPEIINIDVDDDQGKLASNKIKREYSTYDNDVEFISSIKKSRVSKEMKKEYLDESPFLEKIELNRSEPDSDLDSDTKQLDKLYTFSIAKLKKQKERWKSASDMVKDFEKDDELCLNGVCALHRKKITVLSSDTLRLSNLARKLIDGDSQKKLKKKASELNRLDLDHCRMFAKRYSSQLFIIYLKKSDPFFPT